MGVKPEKPRFADFGNISEVDRQNCRKLAGLAKELTEFQNRKSSILDPKKPDELLSQSNVLTTLGCGGLLGLCVFSWLAKELGIKSDMVPFIIGGIGIMAFFHWKNHNEAEEAHERHVLQHTTELNEIKQRIKSVESILTSETIENCANYDAAIAEYERQLDAYKMEKFLAEQEKLKGQKQFWTSLDGQGFEREFAKLLREHGYQASVVGAAGDDGIDIVARKDGDTLVVQCKAYKDRVSPNLIREFNGAWDLKNGKNGEAWFVGLGGFSENSKTTARKCGIQLFDVKDVVKLSLSRKSSS